MTAKQKKKSVRVQNVISGVSAELYDIAISKTQLVQFGIIKLAQDKTLAATFFGDQGKVEEILAKYGIKQYEALSAPVGQGEEIGNEEPINSNHGQKEERANRLQEKPRSTNAMFE